MPPPSLFFPHARPVAVSLPCSLLDTYYTTLWSLRVPEFGFPSPLFSCAVERRFWPSPFPRSFSEAGVVLIDGTPKPLFCPWLNTSLAGTPSSPWNREGGGIAVFAPGILRRLRFHAWCSPFDEGDFLHALPFSECCRWCHFRLGDLDRSF